MEWEHKYVGEKKPSPQTRALRKKRKAGVKFATPKTTRVRVAEILDLMQRGLWFTHSPREYAARWNVSIKRVQQLAAEASRQNG